MSTIQLFIGTDIQLEAGVDIESGILRFTHEDRDLVIRSSTQELMIEVGGIRLENAVTINQLTRRVILTEPALLQVQAILAG